MTAELAIRDVKEGAGLTHGPSGRFSANATWTPSQPASPTTFSGGSVWVGRIDLGEGALVAKTLTRRYLALPGRLTRSGCRRHHLVPRAWPWSEPFLQAFWLSCGPSP